ncbi:MAG: aminotransferase class V-fold PLP-dependent enzyme [Gemmatimonadetes bacterium]|nr:aminotransferase class V-fold PLP-dependent enzyme [Gemmatimonadota bacterium]
MTRTTESETRASGSEAVEPTRTTARESETGPLAGQRDRFALPSDTHFLNCAYMGPLPREAEQAGREALARKRLPTAIVPPGDFWSTSDALRKRFASLVGSDEPERVAIQPGVSYAAACAAKNLPVSRGQNIVLLEEQFPGNVYAWHRLAAESGAELRVVAPGEGGVRGALWNERLLEAVTPETAVVTVPTVHWTDGTQFDLEAVGGRCRRFGAALVVDATQSLGMAPFSVAEVQPDLVVSCSYKWLLGPYSVAFTWMGPRFDDGTPIEETWIGRAGSDDFRRLVNYRAEYRPGAVRYDVAERSNFFLLPIAEASLDLMLGWGASRIEAYCADLTDGLFADLAGDGYEAEGRAWRSSHLFGLRMPAKVDLVELQAELARRRIHVSLRGSALRVSVHVYNDRSDLEALKEVLKPAARG